MKNQKIIDKAKKLYALYKDLAANETNEAKAAKYQLDKILVKYGLTIEDLLSIERKDRHFRYYTDFDRRLLGQLCYVMFGDDSDSYNLRRYRSAKKELVAKLTDAEYIDIAEQYDFYRYELWLELCKATDIVYNAFLSTNELYPDKSKLDPNRPKSSNTMSLDEMMAIAAMANTMTKKSPQKKLN